MPDLTLRLEGRPVKEVVVFGNGKDSELILTADDDAPVYRITVRDPKVSVDIDGKVLTEVFNDGHDPYLGIRYLPREPLVFEVCRIEGPGKRPDLRRSLEKVNGRGEIEPAWMIARATIRLAAGGSRP